MVADVLGVVFSTDLIEIDGIIDSDLAMQQNRFHVFEQVDAGGEGQRTGADGVLKQKPWIEAGRMAGGNGGKSRHRADRGQVIALRY